MLSAVSCILVLLLATLFYLSPRPCPVRPRTLARGVFSFLGPVFRAIGFSLMCGHVWPRVSVSHSRPHGGAWRGVAGPGVAARRVESRWPYLWGGTSKHKQKRICRSRSGALHLWSWPGRGPLLASLHPAVRPRPARTREHRGNEMGW